MRLRALVPLAAVAGVTIPLGLVVPAPATPASSAASGAPVTGAAAVTHARASALVRKSRYFAGYERTGRRFNASFRLKTEFSVPRVRCTSATRGITHEIAVAQTSGSRKGSAVGLFVGCYEGKRDYFPFIVLNSGERNYAKVAVHPRDEISLSLSENPKRTSLVFVDLTRKVTKQRSGKGLSDLGFPGIGDGAWFIKSTELGVPNFGKLHFTHCMVNGKALGASGSGQASAVRRFNRFSSRTLQIAASAMNKTKTAFTTAFKHS